MDILELNAHAEGILTYIVSKTSEPREALAILGMAICMLYDTYSDRSVPFAEFAKDLNESLIATYKDVSVKGNETVQ